MNDVIIPEVDEISEFDISNIGNIINIKQVTEDYQNLRKLVLYNTQFCAKFVEEIKNQIDVDGYDAELINSMTQLIQTSNSSVKLLTESYKKLIDVLEIFKKLTSTETKKESSDIDEILEKING